MSNKIISRSYVTAEIILASPLALSGGMEEHTDSDVMRDGSGRLLIPGSSIAGAFRRYLGQKRDEAGVFGYSGQNEKTQTEDGYMSALFFSDVYFEEEGENSSSVVAERDGVSLTEDKTVDNKFDYEVIEPGATARLRIEKIYREQDAKKGWQNDLSEIQMLLYALDRGEIRLGARKNRGCGWIKVEKVYRQVFGIGSTGAENMQTEEAPYLSWIKYCSGEQNCPDDALWENWRHPVGQEHYVHLRVPLCLTGGISIRQYSTRPNEADYEHMTIHGKGDERIPVIPGSSWNGAIRSCARNILRELQIPEIDAKLQRWFGMVDVSGRGSVKARQSMVVFRESRIEDSMPMVSVRNKINRFDASTVEGALYKEKAYFGGKTTLHILIQKTDDESEYYPLLGLLSLVIREIEEGYLAVGGQTAVGRGVFEAYGDDEKPSWSQEIDEKRCLQELAALKRA